MAKRQAKNAPTSLESTVTIMRPDICEMEVELIGQSDLLVARRHEKVPGVVEAAVKDAPTGKKPTKGQTRREAKQQNPNLLSVEEQFVLHQYRFGPGNKHHGFPASGVKKAMERAVAVAKESGVSKLSAVNFKVLVHVLPGKDGDADKMRINFKSWGMDVRTACNPNANGAPHPVGRPIYREWRCRCRIRFQRNVIAEADVLHLLMHAGQVGLGALRPACGGCLGLFDVRVIDKK